MSFVVYAVDQKITSLSLSLSLSLALLTNPLDVRTDLMIITFWSANNEVPMSISPLKNVTFESQRKGQSSATNQGDSTVLVAQGGYNNTEPYGRKNKLIYESQLKRA